MPDKPLRTRPNAKSLGARGEALVAAHLIAAGWRMLQTNYRTPAGEIDLIAEQPAPDGSEPTLVFIEVKTRRGARHGTPSESVQTRKQQKILAAALYFLAERAAGGAEPLCRFDVAEVCIGPEGLGQIRLLHGAFGMA